MSPPLEVRARLFALVPCAGVGTRSGLELPKQYAPLAGRPLVAHTLAALAMVARLQATLVVLAPQDRQFEAAVPAAPASLWVSRRGGSTRAQTVRQGLDELLQRGARPQDWVLVHDAARCLLRPAWVDRLIDACLDSNVGGLLALPVADTLKRSDDGRHASATLPRGGLWAAQTPQMFRLGLLQQALAQADASGRGEQITDEASAIEALGLAPRLVPGEAENFKPTFPGDFALAEVLLAARDKLPAATKA